MNIKPDIEFISQIKEISKSPVKTCMQCGECSVVCTLAPEDRPFPRKEMIWTGWGLKDKLMSNPDIWLCHQCGDCSTHCPRDIKPADVISSLRQMSYRHHAKPAFMGKLLSEIKYLPLALLLPIIAILAIIYSAGTLTIPEGPVLYSKFFPHGWLNSSFTLITLIVVILTLVSLKKFWNNMKGFVPESGNIKKKPLIKSILEAKREVLTHSNFGKCETDKSRRVNHFLVLHGFIILLLVTALAIVATLTGNYPLSFMHPVKIAGNIAAIMLIAGTVGMMINRLMKKPGTGNSNYFDWIFLLAIFLLTVTGVLVEMARFQNWSLAYHIYFIHLVLVWFLIIYAPYTKFGHFIYRFTAMVFGKRYGR